MQEGWHVEQQQQQQQQAPRRSAAVHGPRVEEQRVQQHHVARSPRHLGHAHRWRPGGGFALAVRVAAAAGAAVELHAARFGQCAQPLHERRVQSLVRPRCLRLALVALLQRHFRPGVKAVAHGRLRRL